MVFGELVIPSSRALWEEEYIELEEYEVEDLEWEGTDILLKDIESLYVVDTIPLIKLFEKCIITGLVPIKKSKKAGLRLYQMGMDVVILYENKPQFTSGEIIQNIHTLIEKAKNIYGITSVPMPLYQSSDAPSESTCFIRTLHTQNVKNSLPKLPIPNLVTGITANLLSYCIHIGHDCQLFVGFLDAAPLDSINTEPFFKLFREINLHIKSYYNMDMQAPCNNLYM